LPEKFVIYELLSDDPNSMQYKIKEKFYKNIDCFLMILCSNSLVLCLVRDFITSLLCCLK